MMSRNYFVRGGKRISHTAINKLMISPRAINQLIFASTATRAVTSSCGKPVTIDAALEILRLISHYCR